MNCLGSCRGRYEFNLADSSAPPYYPPQLPFNPDFIVKQVGIDPSGLDSATANVWSTYNAEFYTRNTFENYDEWGRTRRSLYEGVNCVSVSASACVHRIARCLLQLRISSVCYVCTVYIKKCSKYISLFRCEISRDCAFITDV